MAKVIVAPVPDEELGWIVDTPQPDVSEEPIARRRTQQEAIVRARIAFARIALASIGGGELEICASDGRIIRRERLSPARAAR